MFWEVGLVAFCCIMGFYCGYRAQRDWEDVEKTYVVTAYCEECRHEFFTGVKVPKNQKLKAIPCPSCGFRTLARLVVLPQGSGVETK